jgi:general secretion pathway protein G
MSRRDRQRRQRGFTLIELLVVIIILGILATFVVPKIMGRPAEARRTKAKLDIQSVESALNMFKLDSGFFPSTEQGLAALVAKPDIGRAARHWREEGYLEKGKVPKDPWGSEYVYISPGEHGPFDLISYGGDGEPGGEGEDADVESWNIE